MPLHFVVINSCKKLLHAKYVKIVGVWGKAPDRTGGANTAPRPPAEFKEGHFAAGTLGEKERRKEGKDGGKGKEGYAERFVQLYCLLKNPGIWPPRN
jgi:hypothetical protein